MAGHYLRQRAASAGFAWSTGVFALVLIPVAVLCFRLGLLDLTTLTFSLALAAALAALGLLTALFAVAVVWHRGALGGGRAVAALVVGCLAVLPFAGLGALFSQDPEGNTAETTGLSGSASPAAERPAAAPGRDVLVGRDFQATASVVYGAVRTAMAEAGIDLVDVEAATVRRPEGDDLGVSGTVEVPIPTPRDSLEPETSADRFATLDSDDYTVTGVAYSPVLALPSDVTIRIVEEGDTTFVDMRSVSRTVERDLGENRRIIRGFLDRLEAAMTLLASITPPES